MVIVVDIAKETPLGDSSSSFHSLVALRGVKLLQPAQQQWTDIQLNRKISFLLNEPNS